MYIKLNYPYKRKSSPPASVFHLRNPSIHLVGYFSESMSERQRLVKHLAALVLMLPNGLSLKSLAIDSVFTHQKFLCSTYIMVHASSHQQVLFDGGGILWTSQQFTSNMCIAKCS